MTDEPLAQALGLVERLDAANIWYRLTVVRGALMVEAVVPGEHWEIEFFPDGHIEVERFRSDGEILGPEAIERLLMEDDNLPPRNIPAR